MGPFLEARAGRFTARRAKETHVYKVWGEAAVEIIKAGSEDEGGDPSLGLAESCALRFDERVVVVATLFRPDGEEVCDFPGATGREQQEICSEMRFDALVLSATLELLVHQYARSCAGGVRTAQRSALPLSAEVVVGWLGK